MTAPRLLFVTLPLLKAPVACIDTRAEDVAATAPGYVNGARVVVLDAGTLTRAVVDIPPDQDLEVALKRLRDAAESLRERDERS